MPLRNADCDPKFRECEVPMTLRSSREIARITSSVSSGAAVVNEDDLEVDVQLGERRLEALIHNGSGLVILVAGDDRADAGDGIEAELLG
jgi:hypothetical protein